MVSKRFPADQGDNGISTPLALHNRWVDWRGRRILSRDTGLWDRNDFGCFRYLEGAEC